MMMFQVNISRLQHVMRLTTYATSIKHRASDNSRDFQGQTRGIFAEKIRFKGFSEANS